MEGRPIVHGPQLLARQGPRCMGLRQKAEKVSPDNFRKVSKWEVWQGVKRSSVRRKC